MDRLYCMQVFVRVVENGAFSKAADAMGISRSSATAAIAQLEKRLGVRLLNRTTRRLCVSDEGRSYYANCVRILGEIAEMEDCLSGSRVAPQGRLRVSVPQSFVNMIFFPLLTRFAANYPELEIEVVLTDRAVNLVEEGIDCAIRGIEIPPDSSLVAKTLSATRWLTCATPAYLATRGIPETIEALGGHNCIRFISQSTARPRAWQFLRDGESVTFLPTGNLRLTSFDAVIQTALAGGGIAQIPDSLGYRSVLDGGLQPILEEYVAPAPSLLMVYPGNRYLAAKVRTFIDCFAEAFPKDGWWSEIVATNAVGRDLSHVRRQKVRHAKETTH